MPTMVFPKYRLTKAAIKKINSKDVREALIPMFGVTDGQLIRKIKTNKENGDLTTLAVLEVIQRKTKMKRSDLLEDIGGVDSRL